MTNDAVIITDVMNPYYHHDHNHDHFIHHNNHNMWLYFPIILPPVITERPPRRARNESSILPTHQFWQLGLNRASRYLSNAPLYSLYPNVNEILDLQKYRCVLLDSYFYTVVIIYNEASGRQVAPIKPLKKPIKSLAENRPRKNRLLTTNTARLWNIKYCLSLSNEIVHHHDDDEEEEKVFFLPILVFLHHCWYKVIESLYVGAFHWKFVIEEMARALFGGVCHS